jgi:predicted ATPase
VLEALDRFLQGQSAAQRRADLEGCAWLARLLPELAEMGTAPLPLWTLPVEQERRLMFKAVARLLTNVAGPGGTLLVLDDLQWAGADALDLLATLARAAPEARLRVLYAYRDTEVHPEDPLALLLADLAHAGLAMQHKHTLAPLAPEEATLLLDGLLAGTTAGERALREQVLQRTGGVPFFLVSCAQAMRLRDPASAVEDAIPWDVTQGVRQRVAMLPKAARELLNAAAVVGRLVPRPLLMEAVTQPDTEVIASLEAACRARLLEEASDDAYQFAHDVIHEVVRADLGAAQRVALHRRVAEALERAPGEPPVELLAYHYERAGDYERAITYLVRAAERARQSAAHREEVGVLARAIILAERLGQRGRVAELRAMRGEAFSSINLWSAARAELEAALEELQPERVERRAEVLVELAYGGERRYRPPVYLRSFWRPGQRRRVGG